MIPNLLSATWTALEPALGNHLWQSTLFAIAAGLLTLILRKNQARARYWLWLAASMKFLIPFSLLVAVGSHLAWSRGSAGTKAGLYIVMEELSQPFTQTATAAISQANPSTLSSTSLIQMLPVLLAATWLCGFLVVLFVWYKRWRRVSAAIREAEPLQEGREVEALRRLARIIGTRKRIEMLLSRASLEPGIFGIARPILVWPQGISERLEDPHLQAILAHELWHVRRRDNLASALHMVVEAIFWFYPLVWWIGARLVEERERACDEAVLESGGDRKVYAESILKICEFCVESPLECVSGVTGADLKRRIARIMTEGIARKLDFGRKLLLSAAALMTAAVPIVFGLLHATQGRAQSPTVSQWQTVAGGKMAFDVASVKQNKSGLPPSGDNPTANFPLEDGDAYSRNGGLLSVTNFPLEDYIWFAYKLTYSQSRSVLSQLPKWAATERFDIQAQAEGNPTKDQMRLMMQSLLANRFKLAVHTETRQVPVFALVLVEPGKTGPQLRPHADHPPCDTYVPLPNSSPSGPPPPKPKPVVGEFPAACFAFMGRQVPGGPMVYGARNVTMQQIANRLPIASTTLLDRPVLDQTGLSGNFDFIFEISLSDPMSPGATQSNDSGPTFIRALGDQLGLKLVPQTSPVEILVIDHIEKPGETQAQNSTVASPAYEVASIKLNEVGTASLKTGKGVIMQSMMFTPGTFIAQNTSLQELIRTAYGVADYQISGLPNSLTSTLYDVNAKAGKSVVDELKKLDNAQRDLESQRLLQALLMDRFKLTVHRETKELPVYSLIVSEPGKLHEALGDCGPHPEPVMVKADVPPPPPPPPCGSLRVFPWVGRMEGLKVPITQLIANLAGFTKRMVFDNTHLAGKYDMNLNWFPGLSEFPPRPAYLPSNYQPDPNSPPLLTAIQQQLGLKLELQTGPVPLLVIDHVEMPSDN